MPEKRIVYVLQSESNPNRFYTGLTSDLDRRLASHNVELSKHTATVFKEHSLDGVDHSGSAVLNFGNQYESIVCESHYANFRQFKTTSRIK